MTDVAEIEAALEAATPGPWELDEKWGRIEHGPVTIEGEGDDTWEYRAAILDPAFGAELSDEDAHLIANAPTYLAFLLGRVKVLEGVGRPEWLHQHVDMTERAEAAESRASELESALRATIEAHGFCDDGGCTFAIARALLPPVPVQEEEQ